MRAWSNIMSTSRKKARRLLVIDMVGSPVVIVVLPASVSDAPDMAQRRFVRVPWLAPADILLNFGGKAGDLKIGAHAPAALAVVDGIAVQLGGGHDLGHLRLPGALRRQR